MNMTDILMHPLIWPILAVLLLGAVAYVLSRPLPGVCRVLALAGAILALIGVLGLTGRTGLAQGWDWLNAGEGFSLRLELAATPLGLLVGGAAAGFALLVGLYSIPALAGTLWEGRFHAYLLWALAGSLIVALAGNLLVLLVGWEIVTLMLFLLVNQGRAGAKAGAAKAYGMLGFADACLLLGIALLCSLPGGTGNLSLSAAPKVLSQVGAVGYAAYVLIFLAALAKAGGIPLHTWIPSIAEKTRTPVLAMLPAAADKLLGIYLLALLALRMFRPDGAMRAVMMVVGAVTVLAAVLMAMVQHNLKRLLSFHAVSQVGYMVLGIGTGTLIGAIGGLLHMLNHAIYKSDLFLMSGSIRRATGTDEIEDMGGLARLMPVTFVSGLVAALAISGVPPLNGFVSKWLVYQGTMEVGARGLAMACLTVAVFGSALTLASFVKVMHSAFLAPAPTGAAWTAKPVRENVLMAAPMVVLAAACVLLGLWPQLAINGAIAPFVASGTAGGQALSGAATLNAGTIGLWNPSQATVLIALGMAIGLGLVWIATRKAKVRVIRPFLAGEVPQADDGRFRVPGTAYYETVAKLPGLGGLLRTGQEGAMDLYHWSGKYGQTLVNVFRAQHTGLLGLYVAWAIVGLAAVLAYLLVVAPG